jgi:hypothetical protein
VSGSLRALADEVSPVVEETLDDLSRLALRGGGERLERRPGEITWTLQIQVVSVRVAIVAGDGGAHFWVAYVGPPGAGSSPGRTTTSLDAAELREALWDVMRTVIGSESSR